MVGFWGRGFRVLEGLWGTGFEVSARADSRLWRVSCDRFCSRGFRVLEGLWWVQNRVPYSPSKLWRVSGDRVGGGDLEVNGGGSRGIRDVNPKP